MQDKVDQLQAELEKSRSQYDAVAKEKETLERSKLQETNTKLEQAQNELEKTKGSEKEVRNQLAQAEDSLKKIAGSDKHRLQETGGIARGDQSAEEGARVGRKRTSGCRERKGSAKAARVTR